MVSFFRRLICKHDFKEPTLRCVGSRAGEFYHVCKKCGKLEWLK